jgi:hypothetical protein
MMVEQVVAALLAFVCAIAAGFLFGRQSLRKRLAHLESNERFARECLRAAHEGHNETHDELIEEKAVVRQLLEERAELMRERASLLPELN